LVQRIFGSVGDEYRVRAGSQCILAGMVGKAAHSCVVLTFCRLISLTSFLSLLGCNASVQPTSQEPASAVVPERDIPGLVDTEHYPLLLNRLKQLAGDGALDCGIVGIWQKPDAASNCAMKAKEANKPFFVRYQVQGIDTEQVLGFAGTVSGNVSSVWYFGTGYVAGGHTTNEERKRKLKFMDDGRISIEECSTPVNFRKANNGRVTCFLRDP
jgi:hypothetical protein